MQLLQRLVRKGALQAVDLQRIRDGHAATPGKAMHEYLIEKGFAKEDIVLGALAEEFGMDLVDLTDMKVEPDVLQAMPLKLVHRRTLMPISRENGTLRRSDRRSVRRLRA